MGNHLPRRADARRRQAASAHSDPPEDMVRVARSDPDRYLISGSPSAGEWKLVDRHEQQRRLDAQRLARDRTRSLIWADTRTAELKEEAENLREAAALHREEVREARTVAERVKEEAERVKEVITLHFEKAQKARAGRARGAAALRKTVAANRAVRNAELYKSAESMLRRGLSKSATAKHLGISRDRLDRILLAHRPKKPALS